ncbi:uncharacterized protein LOC114848229 isoform X2 [Betta splendens]|uniref:Uncharacterized protein LOC114848229 isoform X2 n=1 Tax=Betta splendens TaxID=158456 RepID=A0A6P7LJ56_BETSP|nr:uncharacterized protein LOC114848229 isoform X2 [Betta splendens]
MAWRRRRPRSLPDNSNRPVPNNMDHLAFKYMMCKVDTDSDSDSEISPRWSDTSSMGCVSRVPRRGILRRTLPPKTAARHGCSSFLDPYDGSSEDSDDAGVSRQTKQQGRGSGAGGWSSGRGRRSVPPHPASIGLRQEIRDPVAEHHLHLDVPMTCGSDSEVWVCELDSLSTHNDIMDGGRDVTVAANGSTMQTQTTGIELQLDDAAHHTFGPLAPVRGNLPQLQDSSSERSVSPCNLTSIYKRKLGLPGADVGELGQRKRQCVDMEDEHNAMDSTSDPF